MILYSVLTFHPLSKYSFGAPIAICTTLESAIDIVESNEFDIHEHNHDYAVIAAVQSDISYGIPENIFEKWYQWQGTPDHGKYESCEKPVEYNYILFGL